MLKDFKDFLLKQNVVALAIAVVVGTALNTLVKAVVDDFIMPIIVAIGPGGDWQKATWECRPGEVRRWRLHRRRDQLPNNRVRGLADLEDLHQAGGGRAEAELSVLPDVDRRRRHPLPALHQPAGRLNREPPPIPGVSGMRTATSRSRAPRGPRRKASHS